MHAKRSGYAIHDEHGDTTLTTSIIGERQLSVPPEQRRGVAPSCRGGRRVSRRLAVVALSVLSLVSANACTAAKAATPVERPALIVPPPPPRTITPAPLPEVQPAPESMGETPASTNKPAPRPRPQTQRDTVKPEAPKVDPLPEATPPAPVATPPPVTPQLRMPEGGDAAATARQARDTIERTRRMVSNIDPARLSSVLQKALTDAKAFTTQAEEALNAGNVVFAKELAEKAERLAKELQGRLAL